MTDSLSSKMSIVNNNNECETAEDALTTDSDDCLSESLRYRNFQNSASSNNSNSTMVPLDMTIRAEDTNDDYLSRGSINVNLSNIQIPIVGYEIMEERARFTVYKLRVENKSSGDCWYVFRRYTDFVRLCNRLRKRHPRLLQLLPSKRWLKNNFDPLFLEERVNGLQVLVDGILAEVELVHVREIQDFFCLNEPPTYSESNEESRAMYETLEETINELKQQLHEKESVIDSLQNSLRSSRIENDNLKKIIRNSTMNCQKCQKDCENLTKSIK